MSDKLIQERKSDPELQPLFQFRIRFLEKAQDDFDEFGTWDDLDRIILRYKRELEDIRTGQSIFSDEDTTYKEGLEHIRDLARFFLLRGASQYDDIIQAILEIYSFYKAQDKLVNSADEKKQRFIRRWDMITRIQYRIIFLESIKFLTDIENMQNNPEIYKTYAETYDTYYDFFIYL